MRTETRHTPSKCEVREHTDATAQIVGYGAVYNSRSQNLGGFVEQIDPEAFTKTLQEADVRALVNHDANWVIGRSSVGSLRMESDGTGLRYEVDVNLNDPDGRRAVEKIKDGLIDSSSFGFRVIEDEWGETDQGFPLRTLKQVALRDVGPATFPAYLDTTVGERALSGLADAHEVKVEQLVGNADEIRSLITSGDEERDEEPEKPSTPLSVAIARKRLLILERSSRSGAPAAGKSNSTDKDGESE